jgi:3'-phosphoadenosine 5'-phosphosulfate sulfotransferase (PAPS reductase)/FAD synthetase
LPASKIELWHHDVDAGEHFMDWPCTVDYCRKFAQAFGSKLYISYREGGFLREMLRDGDPTAPVWFDAPDGQHSVGGFGPNGVRQKFPQVCADLSKRWCSAYLKIDVGRRIIANDPRMKEAKVLLVTGERAQESSARAKYLESELHASSNKKRTVHQWRPVHGWDEANVWAALDRWRLVPHPCYRLGWGRCSCMTCIFGNKDQWASSRKLSPRSFNIIAAYEKQFGLTIHRKMGVVELADEGTPYDMDPDLMALAMSSIYSDDIIVPEGEEWKLPPGAYRECGGPT